MFLNLNVVKEGNNNESRKNLDGWEDGRLE